MLRRAPGGLEVLVPLIAATAAPAVHSVGPDTPMVTNGTVTQGDIVLRNFGANLLTNPATVTVSGSSSLIHGIQQTLDPASTASGRNAIVCSVDSLGRESP